MIVEANRILREWLQGHPTLGLNAKLTALEVDPGDTVPAIVTFADETTDIQAAEGRTATPMPSCTVTVPEVRITDSEVGQADREFDVDILVQLSYGGPTIEANVRDAHYAMRALLHSLRELHRHEYALSHRTRNNVHLMSCERMNPLGVATQPESPEVTTGLLLTYRGRDITP